MSLVSFKALCKMLAPYSSHVQDSTSSSLLWDNLLIGCQLILFAVPAYSKAWQGSYVEMGF